MAFLLEYCPDQAPAGPRVDKCYHACCSSFRTTHQKSDTLVDVMQTPPYEYALHGITMSRLIELIHPVRAASVSSCMCYTRADRGWDDDTTVIKHTIFRI